jgi:hypothetical protein
MLDFPSLSSHKIPAQSLMIYFVSVPKPDRPLYQLAEGAIAFWGAD